MIFLPNNYNTGGIPEPIGIIDPVVLNISSGIFLLIARSRGPFFEL